MLPALNRLSLQRVANSPDFLVLSRLLSLFALRASSESGRKDLNDAQGAITNDSTLHRQHELFAPASSFPRAVAIAVCFASNYSRSSSHVIVGSMHAGSPSSHTKSGDEGRVDDPCPRQTHKARKLLSVQHGTGDSLDSKIDF